MADDAEEEEVGCYHCFFWEVLWAEDEGQGGSAAEVSAAVAALAVDSEALVAAASAEEEQVEVTRSVDFFK